MSWQTMDSAPKDGTPFDVWIVRHGSPISEGHREVGWIWFSEYGEFTNSDGRSVTYEYDGNYSLAFWMPEPEPPK